MSGQTYPAAVRLGVMTDLHVSVERDEPAEWHNPYRLGGSHPIS